MTAQLDSFLTQIRSLGALVTETVPRFEPDARKVLTTPDIYGIRQIVLTGSGDSYFAALAVAPALRAWTGLPVQPLVSMDASRYFEYGRLPASGRLRGVLVVAISHSGEAARLVEAAQCLRAFGAVTLALTASPQSRMARAAEKCLDISIPPSAPAPGMRSYVASLLGLYLLSIRIAEVRMRMTMDQAGALRDELAGTAALLNGLSERCEPLARAKIESWGTFSRIDVLGSGPAFASAAYTAAKFLEAAGAHATAQDAEEFHHLNFFANEPERIPAILFAPTRSRAASRTRELLATVGQLGRPYAVVTDVPGFAPSTDAFVLPSVDEFFAPLLQAVPGALLAAFAAEQRGVPHARGHTGPWRGARDAALIRDSKIELPS